MIDERVGVTFENRDELKKAFKVLFEEKLPFQIMGFNSLIIPQYVKNRLLDYKFKFKNLKITKLANLTREELDKVRKKQEEQKEKGYKLFNEKYG